MLEHEADDENSSLENEDNISQLMDGIAIFSESQRENKSKILKYSTVRIHKITRAERNLLNNYSDSICNNNKGYHKFKVLNNCKI